MSRTLKFAAALTLLATSVEAQVVVTPANPQGWGIDPFRAPITGVQAITTDQPRNGNGSLKMSVTNNGAERTGYALFAPIGGNFGQLSNMTTLGFDWYAAAPQIQSPTLRLYLDVANPTGGRMTGQFAWYADNSINGTVPANTWTTTNLMDGDGNNNFFLRFFGNALVPVASGNLATTCVNTSRGPDFNARMQGISSWFGACTGAGGTVDLSDASVVGIALDMGAWPGDGLSTYTNYMDNVTLGFGTAPATSYNFETVSVVPEPASVVLLGAGLLGVFGVARRRRNAVK